MGLVSAFENIDEAESIALEWMKPALMSCLVSACMAMACLIRLGMKLH